MNFTFVFPVLISFVISALLGPVVIPYLRRLKVGQTTRDDGPQSHLKKNGTPTMGGIMILLAVVTASLFYIKDYPTTKYRNDHEKHKFRKSIYKI